MSEPATNVSSPPEPAGRVPVVLRILMAILLAIPGLASLAIFCFTLLIWSAEGFSFPGSDRMWMPLFILPSVAGILFSVLTIGIVLRFARWKRAPAASLVLSILAAMTIVLGHQMMMDSVGDEDTESAAIMLACSMTALALCAVPPFLHWWNAHRMAPKAQ